MNGVAYHSAALTLRYLPYRQTSRHGHWMQDHRMLILSMLVFEAEI